MGFRRRMVVMAGAVAAMGALAGCQQTQQTLTKMGLPGGETEAQRIGYTYCNLHHEDDWINDGNYAELPMIGAGAPATVTGYGRNYASVQIDGKPMRLGHDYGRKQETLQQFVEKIIVTEDPKTRLAGFPADVQDAIRKGKVMVGMTREQVIMSIGYPMTSENPSLDSDLWRYWVSSFGPFQVIWDSRWRVKEIAADQLTYNMIVYRPA